MKTLVVDDDRVLADLVSFTLRRAGYEVVAASDSVSALRRWIDDKPDLIILDINLPGTAELQDGFAICRHIRAESDVPIILLTVRGEEQDIVHGLEAGADDYILKPFSPRQLVARVQAVMRRFHATRTSQPAKLSVDGLEFNPKLREVYLANETPKTLTAGPGGGSTEMLRQLVRRLRSKIEKDPTNPHYIQNLPGLGYAFLLKR